MRRPRIGLALGSGGARGFAHLSLLEALHERGVEISGVSGSSMGAVVAAAYALRPDPRILKTMVHHFLKQFKKRIREFVQIMEAYVSLRRRLAYLTRLIRSMSLDDTDFLYSSLSEIFGRSRFSDCKIPCHVVATSFDGELVVINEGYIVDAVAASSSVPGAFPPIRLGGEWLVDGGVVSVVPSNVVREMGAEVVIASHVGYFSPKKEFQNILDYAVYLDDLKGELLAEMELAEADVAVNFGKIRVPWYRFDLADEVMREAHRAIEEQKVISNLEEAVERWMMKREEIRERS